MGSPEGETERFDRETRHYRLIKRTLAVATTEVTAEQFQRFKPEFKPDARYAREPGCPAGAVSWYEALRYCNWLSKKAGLKPGQCCYPEDEEIKEGMVLPDGAFDRPGYRLPTEAEWEYFCRGGTETRRPWGDAEEFLSRYAWTWLNSQARLAPVGRLLPNEFGLFDTIGNVYEWCHDGPSGPEYWDEYPQGTDKDHPAADQFRGAPTTEEWRIIRGGVFDDGPPTARSAHRDIFKAGSTRPSIGFRVVRTVVAITKASE
jgi:formylglycine-generating enzyme required for sulfatase activity